MASLTDIISLVLITVFIPLIFFNGVKLFEKDNYVKLSKIISIVLFILEVFRFFCQPEFYELGRIPKADLKFGMVTFMSIYGLFSTFFKQTEKNTFKKIFVLISLSTFIIGIFNPGVYTLTYDKYSLIKGYYMLESACCIIIGICLSKAYNLEFKFFDLVLAVAVCIGELGLSLFYNYYWQLNLDLNLFYWLKNGLLIVSCGLIFLLTKIKNKKIVEEK